MSFTVDSNGTMWNTFKVKAYYVATTCYSASGTLETTVPGPGSISNDQFTVSSSSLSGSGQFTSSTTATGTYAFSFNIIISLPFPPYVCTYYFNESGTWTASTTLPPPGSFTKASPSDGSVGQSTATILSWNESANATDYDYCIDTNNNATCDTGWINTGTTLNASLNSLSTNTIYYWQVRANNGGSTTYANSDSWWSFKTSTFSDVPNTYWAWSYIERLYNSGVTGGCTTSPLNYCPDSTVTRAQMAIFLLKGIHGSNYSPPAVGGSTGFADVPTSYWAAPWIKQLAAEGVTGGCGGGNFCPDNPVTRAQMAVFLLKSKHGVAYLPPAATGVFADVPVGYWADKWIEQLAAEGITGGCGGSNYCPDTSVTRAQMAVFLVKTFNLP